MPSNKFDIVVACDLNRGIGCQNKLPWRLSQDMKYFRELTKGEKRDGAQNCVIMGRNTWQSIPEKHRPLPERRNIVLTRERSLLAVSETTESVASRAAAQVQYCDSFAGAVQIAHVNSSGAKCFVIGGAKVYEQALVHEGCNLLYLTQIKATFECDVFFPSFEDKFSLLSETEELEENGVRFSFQVYKSGSARH